MSFATDFACKFFCSCVSSGDVQMGACCVDHLLLACLVHVCLLAVCLLLLFPGVSAPNSFLPVMTCANQGQLACPGVWVHFRYCVLLCSVRPAFMLLHRPGITYIQDVAIIYCPGMNDILCLLTCLFVLPLAYGIIASTLSWELLTSSMRAKLPARVCM